MLAHSKIFINERYLVDSRMRVWENETGELLFNGGLFRQAISGLKRVRVLKLEGEQLFVLCYGTKVNLVCVDLEQCEINFISSVNSASDITEEEWMSLFDNQEYGVLCEEGKIILCLKYGDDFSESLILGYDMVTGGEVPVDEYQEIDFDTRNFFVKYKEYYIGNDGTGIIIYSENGEIQKQIHKLGDVTDEFSNNYLSEHKIKKNKLLSKPVILNTDGEYVLGNNRIYCKFGQDRPEFLVAYNLGNFTVDYCIPAPEPEVMFYNKNKKCLCLYSEWVYDNCRGFWGVYYKVNKQGEYERMMMPIMDSHEEKVETAEILKDYEVQLKELPLYIIDRGGTPVCSSYFLEDFTENEEFSGYGYTSEPTLALQIRRRDGTGRSRIFYVERLRKGIDYFAISQAQKGTKEAVMEQCRNTYKVFNGKFYYCVNVCHTLKTDEVIPFWDPERGIVQPDEIAGLYEFSDIGGMRDQKLLSIDEIKRIMGERQVFFSSIIGISDKKIKVIIAERENRNVDAKQYLVEKLIKADCVIGESFCG